LVPGAPLFLSFRSTLHCGTASLSVRQPANRKGKTTNSNFLEEILDWHSAMIEVK
jgi:hypothetical protein